MSAVTVRLACAGDLGSLAAIEASGVETFKVYGRPLGDVSESAHEGHWAGHITAGLLWVADEAGRGPIGFLAAERVDDGLYIAEVDVVMDRQRLGYGRRLMEAAIGRARRERMSSVTLTTFREIPWNAPFYERLGFRTLSVEETPAHLGETMAGENARGLHGRCAMRLAL